jgi:predicted dehydrogenase
MTASSELVRIGILGTAAVAVYAMVDPCRSSANAVIAAVGSRDIGRSRAFAELHGIEKATDYDGLIADKTLDAIYVALPNALHATWSIKALEAGKAVLCEKPLASNAYEARRSASVSRTTGLPLVEAFHWRYHPVAARLVEFVNSRILGEIRDISVRFRYPAKFLKPNDIRLDFALGGGVLMDAGCYCVNLLRMLLGEPVAVRSATAMLASPNVDVAMDATLEFSGGALGRLVTANDLAGDDFDIECSISGNKGSARITNPFQPHLGCSITFFASGKEFEQSVDRTPSYNFQLANFVDVVRRRSASLTPVEDAIANMEVIDAIYRHAGMRPRVEANDWT